MHKVVGTYYAYVHTVICSFQTSHVKFIKRVSKESLHFKTFPGIPNSKHPCLPFCKYSLVNILRVEYEYGYKQIEVTYDFLFFFSVRSVLAKKCLARFQTQNFDNPILYAFQSRIVVN